MNEFDNICEELLHLESPIITNGRLWLRKISELRLKIGEDTSSTSWITLAIFIAIFHSDNKTSSLSLPQQFAPLQLSSSKMSTAVATTKSKNGQNSTSKKSALQLTQLLNATQVNLNTFLTQLTQLYHRIVLEPQLLTAIKEIKEDYTVCSLLFAKYSILWEPYKKSMDEFLSPASRILNARGDKNPAQQSKRNEQLYQIGWLIFIVAQKRLKRIYSGLGDLYVLLLAVLNLVISNQQVLSVEAEVAAALSSLGNFFSATQPSIGSVDDSNEQLVLNRLCQTPHVEKDYVEMASSHLIQMLRSMYDEKVIGISKEESADFHNIPSTSNNINSIRSHAPPHLADLGPELLKDQVLEQNITGLSSHFGERYLLSIQDFDNRLFSDEHQRQRTIGIPVATAAAATAPSLSSSSLKLSPLSSAEANTTISTTKTTTMLVAESPTQESPRTPVYDEPNVVSLRETWPHTEQAWQRYGQTPPKYKSVSKRIVPQNSILQTPVSAAVEINDWIRQLGSGSPAQPLSAKLQSFYCACAENPATRISNLIFHMSTSISKSRQSNHLPYLPLMMDGVPDEPEQDSASASASAVSSSPVRPTPGPRPSGILDQKDKDDSTDRARMMAQILYYQVLESVLCSEHKRLDRMDFSTLLHAETFHRSLYACCAEVSLKSFSLVTLSFPKILETCQVNAFDFGKVLDSFVKHTASSLPSSLRQHMLDIEQEILESLAWRDSSSFYQLLSGGQEGGQEMPREEEDVPEEHRTQVPSLSLKPLRSTIQLFYRKVFTLAAHRIYHLCDGLALEPHIIDQIWTATKEALSKHLDLIRNRHVDHLILCAIYGVCKVNACSPEVSFKRILEIYKRTSWSFSPASSSSSTLSSKNKAFIVRHVLVHRNKDRRQGKEDPPYDASCYGDVITFYNRCYIPIMKQFLLQFRHVHVDEEPPVVKESPIEMQIQTTAAQRLDVAVVTQAAAVATTMAIQSITATTTPLTRLTNEEEEEEVKSGSHKRMIDDLTPSPDAIEDDHEQPKVSSGRTTMMMMDDIVGSLPMMPTMIHHASPQRVLRSNIFVSPRRKSRTNYCRLTPRTHALYAFGESPSKVL